MNKNVLILAVATSLLVYSGCGGSGSSSASGASESSLANSDVLTGRLIDGYIREATVCLDNNANGYCDENEPKATTDILGAYTISSDAYNTSLLAYGGVDIATQKEFKLVYCAPAQSGVITSLTTMLYFMETNSTRSNSQELLKNAFGISQAVNIKTFDPLDAQNILSADGTAVLSAQLRLQIYMHSLASLLNTYAPDSDFHTLSRLIAAHLAQQILQNTLVFSQSAIEATIQAMGVEIPSENANVISKSAEKLALLLETVESEMRNSTDIANTAKLLNLYAQETFDTALGEANSNNNISLLTQLNISDDILALLSSASSSSVISTNSSLSSSSVTSSTSEAASSITQNTLPDPESESEGSANSSGSTLPDPNNSGETTGGGGVLPDPDDDGETSTTLPQIG
jgi:hypothetical protein